jgi:hypothetical protein
MKGNGALFERLSARGGRHHHSTGPEPKLVAMSNEERGESAKSEGKALFRSLTGATSDALPLQHGDPQPGGIRPGQDTGHTPQGDVSQGSQGSGSGTDSQSSDS